MKVAPLFLSEFCCTVSENWFWPILCYWFGACK